MTSRGRLTAHPSIQNASRKRNYHGDTEKEAVKVTGFCIPSLTPLCLCGKKCCGRSSCCGNHVELDLEAGFDLRAPQGAGGRAVRHVLPVYAVQHVVLYAVVDQRVHLHQPIE